MKTLQEKKSILDKLEGFYYFNDIILYEDPSQDIVNTIGSARFEIPSYISHDYNYVLGRFAKYISAESLENALCSGASLPSANRATLYVLSWDENIKAYNGNMVATNDLTQFSFIFNGNSIFTSILYEVNNDENVIKTAGLVGTETFYKTVPNNPSDEDIKTFLFNPENCETINLIFIQIQFFLQKLYNLYQQGKIIQEIPTQWFSNTTNCQEQAIILNDNLLKFYVNVNPTYFQIYFNQNVDIDNILKLYN
jgi:hypothetical protein